MFTFVAFSLKRAWEGFWRNALMSLAATATMVLMLLLLAGFWILQAGLQAGLEYTESKVEVVADLKDTATPADVTAIEDRLHLMPEVKDVHYVSREDALAIYRARLAEQGETDLTRYLDANPLHASLEVKLVDPKVFGGVVEKLRAEPAVDKVKEQQKTVDSLLTITNVLRTAGTVILIPLSPCLIFGWGPFPRMGVTGAALATFTGRSIGVAYQFYRLLRGSERIRILARQIRIDVNVLWRLVRVSLTGILQFAIAHTSWIGLVRIVSIFGAAALAGTCGGCAGADEGRARFDGGVQF